MITESQYKELLYCLEPPPLPDSNFACWVNKHKRELVKSGLTTLEQGFHSYNLHLEIEDYLRKTGKKYDWRFGFLSKDIHEFKRAIDLYEELSPISLARVNLIHKVANTTAFPKEIRADLARYGPWESYFINKGFKNVHTLPTCIEAWKWESGLPKNIAYKVGKLSLRLRMTSRWAWVYNYHHHQVHKEGYLKRCKELFWQRMAKLSRMSPLNFAYTVAFKVPCDKVYWELFLECSLGLPKGSVSINPFTYENLESVITDIVGIRGLMPLLFGCGGKATEEAYLKSDQRRISWARFIGKGNPDLVQKILLLPECIPFFDETIEFLCSLEPTTAIRLLQKTTYTYKRKVCQVSDDLIRDSGYLWDNLEKKPKLKRIRCWLSLHNKLLQEYICTLPDEPLSIPYGWEHIQGLSPVDKSWEIELPTSTATLKYWGELLHNCVGSYGKAIESGRSVVFVVKEDNTPTHCVEFSVRDKRIIQFCSDHNGLPNEKLKKEVIDVLSNSGFIQS